MCGICGVIQISGPARPVMDEHALDFMTDRMTHRGPNDRGTLLEPGVAFGVRRLSIVDVEGGHQPFANESGTVWGMQNGELYNHVEIRRTLERDGHSFRSRCDTEILAHMYERDPDGFERELRGKFALAVWDSAHRRGVVVRDRLGVKPVYYAVAGDLLVFASELKCLLASGIVDVELDYDAIDAFLDLGFFPAPDTPLKKVKKLLPGHRLDVHDGRVDVVCYWKMPEPAAESMSFDDAADGLMSLLEESVRLRLMSDVPLGAMLSGGLDSSVIVALMARNMSEPVKTFSVGFAGDDANELADARLIADRFGTEHHEIELSGHDAAVDLEDLVWSLDEPLADLSALGFIALSELAARHVTVALSGQGADELLGGYPKHRAAALAGRWAWVPRPVRRVGGAAASGAGGRAGRLARVLAEDDPVERLLHMSGKLDAGLRAELYRGRLAAVDGGAARRAVRSRLNGVRARPLETTLYLDSQLALVDDMLHYFDRASMAQSLEVRVPFLDHVLVEFCARMPAQYKVRGLRTKHVLKEAARDLLPASVIDKRKIGFFHDSLDAWFRRQADDAVAKYLLAPDARYRDLMDGSAVEALVRRQQKAGGHAYLALSILMLEVWLRSFLPRATGSGAASSRLAVA